MLPPRRPASSCIFATNARGSRHVRAASRAGGPRALRRVHLDARRAGERRPLPPIAPDGCCEWIVHLADAPLAACGSGWRRQPREFLFGQLGRAPRPAQRPRYALPCRALPSLRGDFVAASLGQCACARRAPACPRSGSCEAGSLPAVLRNVTIEIAKSRSRRAADRCARRQDVPCTRFAGRRADPLPANCGSLARWRGRFHARAVRRACTRCSGMRRISRGARWYTPRRAVENRDPVKWRSAARPPHFPPWPIPTRPLRRPLPSRTGNALLPRPAAPMALHGIRRKALSSSRSTRRPTRPGCRTRTRCPGLRRSCAGRNRRCTPAGRGPSGNTPDSRLPRNPTRFTAARSKAAARACRSRSTSPRTAATTPTIRASSATSARRAWRSTRSRT